MPWRNFKEYAFPHFCLIGLVLRKVQVENATTILITPLWQAQPWYPKALQMSSHYPVFLPTPNKSLRFLRFRRSYVNCPAVVLVKVTLLFFFCLMTVIQSGYVLFLQLLLSPKILHLHILFF